MSHGCDPIPGLVSLWRLDGLPGRQVPEHSTARLASIFIVQAINGTDRPEADDDRSVQVFVSLPGGRSKVNSWLWVHGPRDEQRPAKHAQDHTPRLSSPRPACTICRGGFGHNASHLVTRPVLLGGKTVLYLGTEAKVRCPMQNAWPIVRVFRVQEAEPVSLLFGLVILGPV